MQGHSVAMEAQEAELGQRTQDRQNLRGCGRVVEPQSPGGVRQGGCKQRKSVWSVGAEAQRRPQLSRERQG